MKITGLEALVHGLADHLVGRDPLRIEDHWQVLTKGGFHRGRPILSAVKMNGSAELAPIDTPARTAQVVERVAAVREVLGDERDIAVDFHGRASTAKSRQPRMARPRRGVHRMVTTAGPAHPTPKEEPAP